MSFRNIPRTVFILGLVSFFNDTASEMIYPIVPLFLTSVLHAPVTVVGFIEGFAGATASFTKFIFGYYSDKIQKRKIFVLYGYGFGALSKPLIGLATLWPFVLFARFIDRLGKGLRTAPRDSLLLENATTENKGFIFGVHRAMDSAGAVVGPLIALLFLFLFKGNMRLVFFIAFIPGVMSILLLFFFVHEKQQKKLANTERKHTIRFAWNGISNKFKFFFFVSMLFALGNSSDTFLILRAQNLGLSVPFAVLAYVFYNISQTLFSAPGGHLADKIGAKRVYTYGLLIFSIVYFAFGFISHSTWLWPLFFLYGIYIAFTDGVSTAYISEFIKKNQSGTYFGLYQTGIALSTFLASIIGGMVWNLFNPSVTFYYGASMAFLAFLLLISGKILWKID